MLYTLPGTNDASFFLGGRCCRQQYFQWMLVTVKYTKILLRMHIICYTHKQKHHIKKWRPWDILVNSWSSSWCSSHAALLWSSHKIFFLLPQHLFFQHLAGKAENRNTAFSASKIVKSTNTVIVDTEEDKMSGNWVGF